MDIIFTKDGIERHVYTPANAVQLRADGWVEVAEGSVVEPVVETSADETASEATPAEAA